MRRLWVGVVSLLVLLIIGSVLTTVFSAIHSPLSETLEQAAVWAESGDLTKAKLAVADAQEQWMACRNFSAAILDHRLLEEMEELFAQLRFAQQPDEIAALCARLASRASEMAESQSITWWNLL